MFNYDKSSNMEVRLKLIYFPESEPELKRKLVNYCKYLLESNFLMKDLIELGLWGQQYLLSQFRKKWDLALEFQILPWQFNFGPNTEFHEVLEFQKIHLPYQLKLPLSYRSALLCTMDSWKGRKKSADSDTIGRFLIVLGLSPTKTVSRSSSGVI